MITVFVIFVVIIQYHVREEFLVLKDGDHLQHFVCCDCEEACRISGNIEILFFSTTMKMDSMDKGSGKVLFFYLCISQFLCCLNYIIFYLVSEQKSNHFRARSSSNLESIVTSVVGCADIDVFVRKKCCGGADVVLLARHD